MLTLLQAKANNPFRTAAGLMIVASWSYEVVNLIREIGLLNDREWVDAYLGTNLDVVALRISDCVQVGLGVLLVAIGCVLVFLKERNAPTLAIGAIVGTKLVSVALSLWVGNYVVLSDVIFDHVVSFTVPFFILILLLLSDPGEHAASKVK